jgi:hypothetical protein
MIHELVAELARTRDSLDRDHAVGEARRVLRRWEGDRALVYRQAVRMRVITAACVYFGEFSRRGWRLLGAQAIVGGSEFDLIWQRGERLEADELKTGRFGEAEQAAARVQAERQALAGRAFYGSGFAGVRVVSLSAPAQSFWVSS